MKNTFRNADEAFKYYYNLIHADGIDFDDTRALFNIGFTLRKPEETWITTTFRQWNEQYARAEWEWYLTGNRHVNELGKLYGKIPNIWQRMADEDGNVNSNYGNQWEREYQLDKIVAKLKHKPNTRQAVISIYDGKEICNYRYDTPCTTAIQFTILNNKLNMCVTMRSNDLWYGFCNDQYCFSQLMQMVSERTGYDVGEYYHFAHNLHLYNDKLGMDSLLQTKADYYG